MNFTEYGKALAAAEGRFTTASQGATASMEATVYDAGTVILLTGKDASGRSFRRTAHSVFGAYVTAQSLWGIRRAWHVKDGHRRLVFTR